MTGRIVLIDLDDTLTDRQAAFAGWMSGFLREHKLPREASDTLLRLDRRGLCPRPDFFDQVASALQLKIDKRRELDAYRMYTSSPPVMPGVLSRLREIRSSGGAVLVLSNGVSEVQQRKLKSAGLLTVVDAVLVSDATGVAKPAAAAFDLAVKRARVLVPTPSAIWMVGDSVDNDVRGALACGLLAAWVNRQGAVWDGKPSPHIDESSTAACLDRILRWDGN